MPSDCRRGYIYFDSLCRNLKSYLQVDSIISSAKSRDSLHQFTRFLYSMMNYDDDLFEEYRLASYQMDTNYRTGPGAIYLPCMDSAQGIFGYYDRRTYLVDVPVIIQIHAVDEMDNFSKSNILPRERIKCVSAKVVDRIKGKHIRYEEPNKTSPPDSFIHITYYPDDRRGGNRDLYGNHAIEPSKDYIVFLENSFNGYDGHSSYYKYHPYCCFSSEGGIFPVDENGNVLIPSNYFGYGTKVPLAKFKADLKADIQSIVSH